MVQAGTPPVSLERSQVEPGAELLDWVFQPDPMMQYLVADSTRLLDKPMRFYRAAIQMGLISGAVHTTPAMDGIAAWISPGTTDFTFGQLLRSGFLTATLFNLSSG